MMEIPERYQRMKLTVAIAISTILVAGCHDKGNSVVSLDLLEPVDASDLLFDTSGSLIDEVWSVHRIGEAKIGHRWVRVYANNEGENATIRRLVVDQLEIPRFGGRTSQTLRTVSLETPAGRVLSLAYEMISGGHRRRVAGQPIAGQMRLHHTRGSMRKKSGSSRKTTDLPWSEDIRGFQGIEASLRNLPLQPGQRHEIAVFVPLMDQIQRYEMVADVWEETATIANRQRLLKVDVESVGNSAATERLTYWIDEQGVVQKEARSFLDQTTLRATEMAAMSPNDTIDFDLGLYARVPLAAEFPATAAERARYRVTMTDGDPAAIFANCSYQRISSVDEHTALIDVGIDKGDQPDQSDQPPTPHDIEPNRWIESAHESIVSLADAAAGSTSDPHQAAVAIGEYVFRWLDKSESDQVLATARQAAEGRKGDCTEHAMLTAAACRARGIPARVAIGLIYDDPSQSMVYHMWTEIWVDDAWLPIDATRPHEGFVAARLKLSDSDLASASDFGIVAPVIRVAGQLTIEVEGS